MFEQSLVFVKVEIESSVRGAIAGSRARRSGGARAGGEKMNAKDLARTFSFRPFAGIQCQANGR